MYVFSINISVSYTIVFFYTTTKNKEQFYFKKGVSKWNDKGWFEFFISLKEILYRKSKVTGLKDFANVPHFLSFPLGIRGLN